MSRVILPPGGKKAREAVDKYLNSIIEEHREVEKKEQANAAAANDLQKIRRKQYEELKHKDILAVYEDDERRKEWVDTHMQLAEANLRNSIQETGLDEKTLASLKESKEDLLQDLSELDARMVSEEQLRAIVGMIREAIKRIPAISEELVEYAGFDIQDRVYKRCDEMRELIERIEAHVKEEAVSEMEKRVMVPSFWGKIMEDVQAADAPRGAWVRNEEIEDLNAQLSAANGEVSRLESLNENLLSSNEKNEKLATDRQTELLEAREFVEAEKARRKKAEDAVAAATLETGELRQKHQQEMNSLDHLLKLADNGRNTTKASLEAAELQIVQDREASQTAVKSLQEAHKREIEAIKQDVREGLSSLQIATSDLSHTEELLKTERGAHDSTKAQLSTANGLLDTERAVTRDLQGKLEDAESQLKRETRDHEEAEREMKDLRAAGESEKRKRMDVERASEAERERSRRKQLLLDEKTSESQKAKAACNAADVKLGGEEAAHAATKNLLADARLGLEDAARESLQSVQQGQEALEYEQRAHQRTKRALEEAKNDTLKERVRNQERLRKQQQISTDLQSLAKTKGAEQEARHQAVAAFLTFSSSSLVQGSWSPLFLASGGVHLNSRFNQAIEPSVAVDLPWIHGILDRVIKAVTSSETGLSIGAPSIEDLTRLFANCKASLASEGVPALPAIVVLAAHQLDPQLVLVVLLQGIAYMYLALRIAGDVELRPTPSRLLDALSEKTRGPMLKQIYERVFDLVHGDNFITSWIDDDNVSQRFDSRNSALPEGVVLFQSAPGVVFMTHSGRLFVFDERVVRIDKETIPSESTRLPDVYMRLPPIAGLNFDSLKLRSNKDHTDVLQWAIGIWIRAQGSS